MTAPRSFTGLVPLPLRAGAGDPSRARDAGLSALRAAFEPDEQFLFMLRAFRLYGGLSRLSDLRLRGLEWPAFGLEGPGPLPIRFDWAGQIWLPGFQFDGDRFAVRADVRRVVAELTPAFEGWELAHWFAQPNAWLDGCAPVERLAHDVDAVSAAARADRFVALG